MAAAQPRHNEDRTVALVANGEIYNHAELRRDLESRGHRFSTHSDCETIVHLYEDEGIACVDKLRGMFAFALMDERSGRVMIARDRMGEKPLYIVERPDALVFSSELGSLIACGVVPFEMDYDGVKALYHWNYLPEPLSAVRGVRRLPAAALLDIDPRQRRVKEHVYWRLEDAPPLHDEPVERIRQEIHSIGQIIAGSDVPVGVTLSGGMDSSAVAAMAARQRNGDVTAFSVGYEGYAWQDERAEAAEFAGYLRIPVHELRLRVDDVVRGYPAMVQSRDEPSTDMSGSAWLEMGRLAREHGVKVLLTGSGGDELFWGYPWIRAALLANRRKRRLLGGEASALDYRPWRRRRASRVFGTGRRRRRLRHGMRGWRRDRRTPADQMVFWDDRQELGDVTAAAGIGGPGAPRRHGIAGRDPRGENLWSDLETSITVLNSRRTSDRTVAAKDRRRWRQRECRSPLVDHRSPKRSSACAGGTIFRSTQRLAQSRGLELVPPFVRSGANAASPPWRSGLAR